jgi:hypothetical protein
MFVCTYELQAMNYFQVLHGIFATKSCKNEPITFTVSVSLCVYLIREPLNRFSLNFMLETFSELH